MTRIWTEKNGFAENDPYVIETEERQAGARFRALLGDGSALRVVELAQPFPPLPRTSDDIDILQVTRTWVFLPGGQLHDDR